MRIPVVGPTYNLDARAFDAQRCVNLYPEISESGTSKNVARMVGTPGKELFSTAGTGPIRGCITTATERSFWVSGNTLYEVSKTGVATNRGTISSAVGTVQMAENGTQILIVDGIEGYIFNLSANTLTAIADADFPDDATTCTFIDTYFVVNDPDTGDFYISNNNDGTSWSALDKQTVESSPDNLRAVLADHGELYLAGSKSIEVYYNSGDASFPFDRVSQAVLQVGIAASHTLKSFDNSVLWLSEDEKGGRFIYRMTDGYRPTRVSNIAVEKALEGVRDISSAYAWVYKQQGHEFYLLQVPGLSSTWVLDASTGMWHERMYYNSSLGREELDRASCHTFFNGYNLVGDRESGKIYKLNLSYYKDDTDAIHAIRVTPHFSNEMKQITINSLYLDMETGVGLEDGSDPLVMMRVSKDGGRTFGYERTASIGKIGEYNARPRWNRLGISRDWVWEFRITDPVQRTIIDCYAEGELGIN